MGMVSYPNHTVNQDLVQTAPGDNYFGEDKYPLLFPSPIGDSPAPLRDVVANDWFIEGDSFKNIVTNRFSHPYHLDKSTLNFRGIGSNFLFLYENQVSKQKSPRWDAILFAYVP